MFYCGDQQIILLHALRNNLLSNTLKGFFGAAVHKDLCPLIHRVACVMGYRTHSIEDILWCFESIFASFVPE